MKNTKKIIKKSDIAILFVIFNLLTVCSSAYAWKMPLEVSTVGDEGEKVYNKLVVGVEPDALDNFDNLWDTPAMLSHPDHVKSLQLRAYLSVKDDKGKETNQLWKDIKANSKGEKQWNINIDTASAGKVVVMSWEVQDALFNNGERLLLKDNDKTGLDGLPVQVDISKDSSYSFVSDGTDTRTLTLTLSKESTRDGKSESGSGFGCGTITSNNDSPPNIKTALFNVLLLFSPLLFLKTRQTIRSRACKNHNLVLTR